MKLNKQLVGRIQKCLGICSIAVISCAVMPATAQAQAAAPKPKAQAGLSTPVQKHYVFAHYMVCFFNSVDFYKREIQIAQRNGIDGFALNAGDWLDGEGKPGNYIGAADNLYQAAKELGTGFKFFFSPDLNGLRNLPVNIGDMVKRYKDHPNQMRYNGKVVVSGWAGGPEAYADAITKIKAAGDDVFFVPFVNTPRYSVNWSAKSVNNFYENQPHMDGVFYFGADGIVPELIRSNRIGARVSHEKGKVYMAGVSPAFNSPNLRDFHGMQGYDSLWKGLIADNADWVEIVTWNDYNEDASLMPFQWPVGDRKDHYSRDEAFLELTGYYAAWYKSGVQPKITQDKLYYGYRNRSKNQTKGWDPQKKAWYDIREDYSVVDQMHDDVQDNVYATTFLTAPADLTISIGDTSKTFAMPAGIGHAAIPMQPGVPHFTLSRKGAAPVINVSGRKLIIDKETEENSRRGYHVENRLWAGAAAAGQSTRYEAEAGTLSEGATIVKDGAVSAVQNLEKENSGFSLPVKNLKDGVYNVRITYSNPGANEARLTLFSDGPWQVPNAPYFMTASLPPTGKGKYATNSFFWSLSDKASFLKLAWTGGLLFGQPNPDQNDNGSVLVDAIELIPVAPVVVPTDKPSTPVAATTAAATTAAATTAAAITADAAFEVGSKNKGPEPFNAAKPEMIAIPAGTFQMGAKAGDKEASPDETPVHAVTLSAFSIGKTEVTNAQFEQFDARHKDARDEFSSRDSDPVVQVSWYDAIHYCNWLSKQQGLTPAYDEATNKLNRGANGYRLPTEAEWEYVASGRGENRLYPWGEEVPDATRGNFLLQAPGSAGLPDDFIGYGTVAAGSFPAGASRDGVLDMAGNATEWLADFYKSYTADAQNNPFNEVESTYRSIRGSSWGYYGRGARATDREYNNAGYPGYIYTGFRVARSG